MTVIPRPPPLASHPVARRVDNVLRDPPRQWFVDYLPVTGGNEVQLLVDGEEYGRALHQALMGATKQVLLTGLHFQPTWRLLRGNGHDLRPDHPHTLLNVLRTLATRGVQIYLIVNLFWENEWTTSNPIKKMIKKEGAIDFYLPETSELFTGLASFPNVKCRADVHKGFVMSTHHQKTVVIDEKLCFVGGIDLTLVDGDRWDTHGHKIPATAPAKPKGQWEPYGAADDRRYSLPEHFWHDVHCKLQGPAVKFVLDNFHARWNHGVLYQDMRRVRRKKYYYPPSDPMGMGGMMYSEPIEYEIDDFEILPDDKGRYGFPRITVPPSVYQDRMRQRDGIHLRESDPGGKTPAIVSASGLDSVPSLPGIKVQVVRSMPAGRFDRSEQKPVWNLTDEPWERSCKDAYLIGIRAAREYIYIENQWISDEDIWSELKLAMRRNRANPKFRIVIMLPRRPLSAAGYGTDQDVNLEPSVKKVLEETASTDQFGMYCVERVLPPTRRDNVALSDGDIEEFGRETAQIYIHSKVMIVDDCWALIGSANAGGISLMGMTNLSRVFRGGRGSTPDSELSVIIHDPAFAKRFRESLWKEHLDETGLPGSVDAAADKFRDKISVGGNRVRAAVLFHKQLQGGSDAIRRIPPWVVQQVRDNTQILAATPGVVSVLPGQAPAFSLSKFRPGPSYTRHFRWVLEDEKGKRWDLRGIGTNRIVHNYGPEDAAYIPAGTAASLRQQSGMQGVAKLMCRILITPVGLQPRGSGDDDDAYGVLLQLPVVLKRS
jgi:phosphatidylserine/phosphatidylglycerophosphate/cardiolipin synthase-like enzyme